MMSANVGGSNVIWDFDNDRNRGSTAQPAWGFRGTLADCYCLRRSRVHRGECRMRRVASFWRRCLFTTLLVCGSSAVSLLLLEGGLRLFLSDHSPLNLDIYRLDEHGLLGLRPGVTRRHVSSEWDVTVAINMEGLRDRSEPVLGRNGRILALGDSIQFGWGVQLSQTYLYIVEEGLDSVRVVKA